MNTTTNATQYTSDPRFDLHQWANQLCAEKDEPEPVSVWGSLLFNLMLDEIASTDKKLPPALKAELDAAGGSSMYNLAAKRGAAEGLNFSEFLYLGIAVISETPAEAVMYLYAVGAKIGKEASLQSLGDVFTGFPGKASLSAAWDAQKSPKGFNYLDSVSFS